MGEPVHPCLVFLIIGFILGYNYKAYQVRSVLKEGFSQVSELFNGNDSIKKTKAEDREISQNNKLIEVNILNKEISQADFSDYFRFNLELTNKSDKDIKAFKARLIIFDIFKEKLKTLSFDHTEGLKAGDSIKIDKYWDYNSFIDDDIRLKELKYEDMSYKVEITDIIYP